jgi:TetR/AcrR family transcriptional repressor of nem operon
MARTRNENAYVATRDRLIEAGLELIRSKSFDGVGISEVLAEAGAPKGSFYHYFESKDDFGLAVADTYHSAQMAMADDVLNSDEGTPRARLQAFFNEALNSYSERNYADGCLMCNLSTELGDQNPVFQERLSRHWAELIGIIADSIDDECLNYFGLSHLTNIEAADQLITNWSGALTRMKAERHDGPLRLFMKTYFQRGH